MKDLEEDHNIIIIQELIPSSAFGSSFFVQSVPSLGGGVTILYFQMQNILTGTNEWFLISLSPSGTFSVQHHP